MPLDGSSHLAAMSWRHTRQNDGFLNAIQGPDSLTVGSDDTGADIVFAQTKTLAASAKQTYDLTSLTNLLSQSISFGDVVASMVSVVSGSVTISPGSSNAATLFMGGTTPGINIPEGGFVICASDSSIDATHKNVDLTAGGSGAQFRIAFLGGV
jgi:hypothetical protein